MANVVFEDNTVKVTAKLAFLAESVLEEVAGELESQVKRNTAVDTGETKNSWTHRVTGSVMAGQYVAIVGSDYNNALYEEFGTGEYALNGDGRKGGWVYQDPKWGIFVHTMGKQPRRALYRAYTALRDPMVKHIQTAFKGL